MGSAGNICVIVGNTLPNGAGVQSLFGSAISAPQTVTLDDPTAFGSITFNNANAYTIAPGPGSNSLTLDNAGTAASVTVLAGNHTISAPVVLTSAGLNVSAAASTSITFAGKITGPAPLAITGPGAMKLGTGIGEVDLTGLTISGAGSLDIANNHLLLTYTGIDPASSILAMVKSGSNGGQWNGTGIDSSTANTNNAHYGIAYADGADGVAASFTSGQIEVAYALLGDIKLHGVVNALDFGILAGNFGKAVTGGWEQGDLNYDGVVNAVDFGDLAGNFGKSASGTAIALPASDWAALDSFAAVNGLLADVPEPTFLSISGIGFCAILRRRRRNK